MFSNRKLESLFSSAKIMSSTDLSAGSLAPFHMTQSDMALSPSVAGKAAPPRSFASATQAFFSMQRESAAMRFIARGVLTTWLLPLMFAFFATLTTPLGAPVAQAQGAPAQSVIVLDFATDSGLDPLLGRKAADGLAVELQRSGSYTVVPRQTVEETVSQQAGLQPPYNDIAQIKLAEAVNASSVFSGRITNVQVVNGRSARVTLETRQLDVVTGDYINGTVVSQPTEQKLGEVANEILVDEAINKAVFAAVRSMRQTTLPTGTVLNVATDEVVLSIGADAGVSIGERFSVLRDKYDRARNVTERSKIGEVTITRVNATQSSARVSAGGQEGVATSDRVRQIFVPGNYPVTGRGGNSVTPVTAPPSSSRKDGFAQKAQSGLFGILGLAALVALAGFGGGSNNGAPKAFDIAEANPTTTYPQPRFSFTAGFNGIGFAQTLDRESVVAYLVYRGTAPGFTADASNLQAVVDGRFDSANKVVSFTDGGIVGSSVRRRVEITSPPNTDGTSTANGVDVNFTGIVAGADILNSTTNAITIEFTQRPLTIGQTYYYRVGRITAQRQRTTVTSGTTTVTAVTLLPVRSPISAAIGGYTPLFLPMIVPDQTYNTDNFSVRVTTDLSVYSFFNGTFNGNFIDANGYNVLNNSYVGSGATQFRFEVSTSQSFPRNATFVSPDIPTPPPTTSNFGLTNPSIILGLGNASDIRIPSSPSNPYIPGVTALYIRVLSRNTNDANPVFRISPTVRIDNAAGLNRVSNSSRFLSDSTDGSNGGINLNRGGGSTGRTGSVSGRVHVLPPQ